jgi:hypothetical protein
MPAAYVRHLLLFLTVATVALVLGGQRGQAASSRSVRLLGIATVASARGSASSGRGEAFQFTATRGGVAHAIHVYLDRTSRASTLVLGLYTSARGHPARRLAAGSIVRPSSGRWLRIEIRPTRISRREDYWIAVLGLGGTLAFRHRGDSGCHGRSSVDAGLRRLPSRWKGKRIRVVCPPSAYVTGSAFRSPPRSRPAPPPSAGSHSRDCFSAPGACGYPDPSYRNVGASSACSSLPHSGSITIRTAGQTVQNLNVTGSVTVREPNVTLNNVCVTYNGGGQLGSTAVDVAGGASNTLIENSTVAGANNSNQSMEVAIDNTGGGSATMSKVYAYNCGECIHDGPWTVKDSYVITNGMVGTGDHLEALYCSDQTETLSHDTLLNPADQTAAVFCDTHWGGGGACDNHISINNSLLAGGGFTLYPCGNASSVGSSTMNISNNRFARCITGPIAYNSGTGGTACKGSQGSSIGSGADSSGYWPYGGYFGLDAYIYCPPTSGQAWSGNVWDDNGATAGC